MTAIKPRIEPQRLTGFRKIVAGASSFTLALVILSSAVARADAQSPARVEQVIVVFKTHFDIGYTDMAENVVRRYRTTMIDDALAVVDQNRPLPREQQFAWTVPGWPMHQVLDWPEQTPERKRRVEQALQDGRFVMHALPFTTHTESLELEDLVRGMGFASRISRRLGLPLPRDAKMTDVACHTWLVPTLLKHAGVDFFHLGSGIHGLMADPHGARLARNTRPVIAAGELLNTQLRAWGVSAPSAAPAIAAAYEQSLLYGEHTWGAALWWTWTPGKMHQFPYGEAWQIDRAEGRFAPFEESWKEHTRYIESARDLIRPLLQSQLENLAGAVNVPGQRIVVFNPLPRPRSGLVNLPLGFHPIAALQSVDDRQIVPIHADRGQLRFVARDVPALGYRTYVPLEKAEPAAVLRADETAATMESDAFKAVIDPARGVVRSLVDKRSGRELLDSAAAYGFGQYLYERFDADQATAWAKAYVTTYTDWFISELSKPSMPPASEVPYRKLSPARWSVRWEQTPVSVAAVMHAPAGTELKHAVTTRLVLYRELPFADLELTVHDKPADSWPEAGWICLPLKVASPQFRLGRPGSIIAPATDILPGANRHLLAIKTGLTVTEGTGAGVGLCPLDKFVVSLDTPGCFRYSRDFAPRKPLVFVNLFNNHWTTNFRMWNEGTWTARVRLWAVDRYEPEAALIAPSLEARHLLLAAHVGYNAAHPAPAAGPLPAAQGGLEVSRPGVQVTAFGDNPDGAGTVLRLWELAG